MTTVRPGGSGWPLNGFEKPVLPLPAVLVGLVAFLLCLEATSTFVVAGEPGFAGECLSNHQFGRPR